MSKKSNLNTGRVNQKHRTRNALLQAAADLMRQGLTPSIEEIADAAQVSRATAYRYFPTQEHILAGSAVMNANLGGEERLKTALETDDVYVRLDNVILEFHERFSSNEVAYRTLLRVLLQSSTADIDSQEKPQVRGSRHIHWLHEALVPVQEQLSTEEFDTLVMALAASTGFEAFVTLRDNCLLDTSRTKEIMCWTARALLQSALNKTGKIE
jgi:AcrR family transcriptional regulator